MEGFPEPVERYLAEVRSGASDEDAVAAADKSLDDLDRWKRNRAFREARTAALGERVSDGEDWVMVSCWGSTEFWAPRRPPAGRGVVDRVALPSRPRTLRPWQARRTLFTRSAPSGTGL